MKKLFLSVAALLCATLMFSQNTSDVKQTGVMQFSDVNQTGQNISAVEQHNYANVATVTQDGGDPGGDASHAQVASIYQDGVMNDAAIVQGQGDDWANDASAIQYGFANVSRQNQLGDNNEADVFQYGEENLAVQEQVSPIFSVGNTADITQGNYGYAVGNVAIQSQFGEGNDAEIDQENEGNYASQIQTGNFNAAVARQDGKDNHSVQNQVGDDNTAWARQNWLNDYWDDALSGNNLSVQTQDGTGNEAYVAQDRAKYSVFTDYFTVEDFVYGSSKNNEARQDQSGMYNYAGSVQAGQYNLSLQDQYGFANVTYMQQDGWYNDARDMQDGDFNWSETYQLGESNRSVVNQYGAFHTSKVDQQGYDNRSNVLQN